MIGCALRLVYLSVTNVFALLRLLPVSYRDKDVEILTLRHQVTILQRQLGTTRPRLARATGRSWPPCCTGWRSPSGAGRWMPGRTRSCGSTR
jgi:hypothetical protein